MDDTVQKISDLLHEAGELAFLPGRELASRGMEAAAEEIARLRREAV